MKRLLTLLLLVISISAFGQTDRKDKHEYDHLSILAQGKVRVLFDDDVFEIFEAPACINIRKGVNHTIMALEDSTWFCIHHTFETDMDKVDNVLIMKEGA